MLPLYSPEEIRRYTGGNINSSNPNDIKNLKNLVLLAGADSIHDFNDRGVRVPISTWNNVFVSLLQNLNALSNTRVTTLTDWTQGLSSNQVSAGTVEEKTVSYFESDYPGELLGKTVKLTYRQVIDTINSFNRSPINDAILQANQNLCANADILEIDMAPNENWNTSYSQDDKKKIGLFLLNFYFPPPNSAYNTQFPSYITFDAGSNIPSKIFGLLDQVINLVTPLNIADSATEGTHLATDKNQKRAGVKNKYVFPLNNGNQYVYNSNIFTMSNGVNLYIEKQPGEYNETNKYNFTVFVQQGTGTVCNLIPFTNGGKTYRSGPGVEYLSEVMNKTPNAKPSTGVIAPINQNCEINIANKTNALYLDVKRSGDWEQCLAALTVNKLMAGTAQSGRVILSTIDRLCALFSRCIGQNTLYHYGTNLILFRYNTTSGNLSPAELAAQLEARVRAETEELASATEPINKIIAIFTALKTKIGYNGVAINVSINGFTTANNNLKTFITQLATLLFFASILKYDYIMNTLIGKTNKTLDDVKTMLQSLKELTGEYITFNRIDDFITTIGNFTNSIKIDNTIILPKGRFCYYDSALLNDIYNSLLEIDNFNANGRVTKTMSNFNYKTRLEDAGLFSNLNKISNELDIISKPILDSALATQLNQPITNAQANNLEETALDVAQSRKQQDIIINVHTFLTNLQMNPNAGQLIINSLVEAKKETDIQIQSRIESQIEAGTTINNMSVVLSNQDTPITVKSAIYFQALVTLFSLIQYRVPVTVNTLYIDYTNSNKEYYTYLQNLLKAVISTSLLLQVGRLEPVNNKIQTGGQLNQNEGNNLVQNLWSTITSEFVSLTAALNDIAEEIKPERINPARNNLTNEQKLLETLSSNQTLSGNSPVSINNDIIALLQVFFENSWNAITEAEELVGIIPYSIVKESYYILYIFFGCLYGKFETPYNLQTDNPNIFLQKCIFFNDYVNINNQFNAIQNVNTIIQYCLGYNNKDLATQNAIVLCIFLNIYGILNINILKVVEKKPGNISLSDRGYYPSIFATTGSVSNFIVTKTRTIAKSSTLSVLNDDIHNEEINIFRLIPIILNTIVIVYLSPINGPSLANTYINTQFNISGGGKRTRKNRRKKMKQKKTIKRRKQMKQKKTIRRRKQQKLRKQRKTMKKK